MSRYIINNGESKFSRFEIITRKSRDIIEFLAKGRNIKNYKRKSNDKLLQAIKVNKINKQQPKNKKRIDIIREDLKDLSHKLSKGKLFKIRENLYNIEKKHSLIKNN